MYWEGASPAGPAAQGAYVRAGAALQVDVIKKAYVQEEERENSEVSPREVGHNIYILALQVGARAPPLPEAPPLRRPRPMPAPPHDSAAFPSFPGTTNSCSTC